MKKNNYKSASKLSNILKKYPYIINASINVSNHHNLYSMMNGVRGLSTLTTSPSLEIVSTPDGDEVWFTGEVGQETVLLSMVNEEGYLLDEGRVLVSGNKLTFQLPLNNFTVYSNIDCLSSPDQQVILEVQYKDLTLMIYLSQSLSLDIFLKLAKNDISGKRKIKSILFLIQNCLLGKLQKVTFRNKDFYIDYSLIGSEQDEQCWSTGFNLQTAYHTVKLMGGNSVIHDIEIKPLVLQGMGYEVSLYCDNNSIIKLTY